MTDDDALPSLQEGMLDDAMLDALFGDIAQGAELLEIVWKGGAEAYAGDPDAAASLAAARAALRERTVFGVQLRYVHAGTEWWDTLMLVSGGTRLVRMNRSHLAAMAPT